MAFGGDITKRGKGFAKLIGTIFEMLGVLNKGSTKSPASPDAGGSISSNSLNVTRVGGLSMLVAAVGAAALALFKVNKMKDNAHIVATAYISVGVIVAASLLAVAIIIATDIRARAALATVGSPPEAPNVKAVNATTQPMVTLARAYGMVLVDAAAGNVEVTLPTAQSCAWHQLGLRRTDTAIAHRVTINCQGGETINGHNETHLLPEQELSLYSTGAAWVSVRP